MQKEIVDPFSNVVCVCGGGPEELWPKMTQNAMCVRKSFPCIFKKTSLKKTGC